MKCEQRNGLGYLVDSSDLESMQHVAARIFLKERVGAQDDSFNQFSSYLQDSGSVNHFLFFNLFLLPRSVATYESDRIRSHPNSGKMFLRDKQFHNTLLGMKLAHCKKKREEKRVFTQVQNEVMSRSEIQFTEEQAAAWMMLLHSEMIARQQLFCSQQSDFFNSIHAVQCTDFARNEEKARCRLTQSVSGGWGSLQQQFKDQCKAIQLQKQIRLFQEACARYHAPLGALRQTLQNTLDDKQTGIASKISAISAAALLQVGIAFSEEIINARGNQSSVLLSIYGVCYMVSNLAQFKKNFDSLTGQNKMPAILCEMTQSDSLNRLLCESVFKQPTLFRDNTKLDQFIFTLTRVYYFYFYMITAVNLLKFFLPFSFIELIAVQKERLAALISRLFSLSDTNANITVKKIASDNIARTHVEQILRDLEVTRTTLAIPLVTGNLLPHPMALAFYDSLLLDAFPSVIVALESARGTIFLSEKTASATSTIPAPRVR